MACTRITSTTIPRNIGADRIAVNATTVNNILITVC
jgi:hypothetical protein